MSYRFAHCSDIHLLSLRGERLPAFFNKRITGAANLLFHRRKRHDSAIFSSMVAAFAELELDRVVITGDLTNLSLQSEFREVRQALSGIDIPVTVIPGNHDTYVPWAHPEQSFEHWMAPFQVGERMPPTEPYPFTVTDGPVEYLALSSAVPTPVLDACGRIGPAQLARARTMLANMAGTGRTRVVLVHHPIIDGHSKAKRDLLDRAELMAVLLEHGAELVLHGHEHRRLDVSVECDPQTKHGRACPASMRVAGISSGTARAAHSGRSASFSVYELDQAGKMPRETLMVWDGRAFVPSTAPVDSPTP